MDEIISTAPTRPKTVIFSPRISAERSTATKTERAVANVVSYINDKLTIKEPPVKDKTIRAFPFRASASALLSAVVACAFMLSFIVVGARLLNTNTEVTEVSLSEDIDQYEECV